MTALGIRDPAALVHHAGFLLIALFFMWSTSLAQNLGQRDFAAGNDDAYQDYLFKNDPEWRAEPKQENSWRAEEFELSNSKDRFQIDDPSIFDEMVRNDNYNARGDKFRAIDPAPAFRLRLKF